MSNFRKDLLEEANIDSKIKQANFEEFVKDEKESHVLQHTYWNNQNYVKERCVSLMPITLVFLRSQSRNNLINIVLLREIAYDDLVKRYNEDIKQSQVYKFFDENGKNVLSFYQKKNSNLISLNNMLENRINKLECELKELKQSFRKVGP